MLRIAAIALLGAALLALAGCASGPRPRSVMWRVLPDRQAESPAPQIESNELVLDGRAVRTQRTFSVPLTVELEVATEPNSTNAAFFLQFDPVDAIQRNTPADFLAVKLRQVEAKKTSILVWISQGAQPRHLLPMDTVVAHQQGSPYRLGIESKADGLALHIDQETFKIDAAFPYDQFYVQLRTFPPPSRWRVRSFTVR